MVSAAGACARRSDWNARGTGTQVRGPTPLEAGRPCCSFLWLWFAAVATLWRSIAHSVQRKAPALTWLRSQRGECPDGTAKQPNSLSPAAAQKTRRRSDRSLHCPVQVSMRLCLAVCMLFQFELAASEDSPPPPPPSPSPPPPSPPPPSPP